MGERYYIDTAIWIDFHENRKDRFRPLGEWALEMFKGIVRMNGIVIYSDMVLDELLRKYPMPIIEKAFNIIPKRNLKKVYANSEQSAEARKLSRERELPFGDCFHAILARDNFALMVSRDKHFEQLKDIVDTKRPEELF
ncbi:MAG: PIN domain-containing protein [Candidatus Nanoarchaeia archaeon]|nr:PIN domain-containing protein [Candidatus Nanoarchaeia archaeon]